METCRECLCFVYLICRNRVPVRMIWNISKTFLSGYLVGCSYGFLWYFSILLGFYFLYAPCLLVLPLSRPLYRRLTDTLYSSWEAFNVVSILSLSGSEDILINFLQSLLQSFYGVKIVLTGDNFISENALIVINHPTRYGNQ